MNGDDQTLGIGSRDEMRGEVRAVMTFYGHDLILGSREAFGRLGDASRKVVAGSCAGYYTAGVFEYLRRLAVERGVHKAFCGYVCRERRRKCRASRNGGYAEYLFCFFTQMTSFGLARLQ